MESPSKTNPAEKKLLDPESLPTTLNVVFPGKSALVPRKQRELEKGLRKEVVRTIDETFGQD